MLPCVLAAGGALAGRWGGPSHAALATHTRVVAPRVSLVVTRWTAVRYDTRVSYALVQHCPSQLIHNNRWAYRPHVLHFCPCSVPLAQC